jgi:hypothetical protein
MQHFLATFINFRFHADGTPAGRAEVTERIALGENPHHFTATAVVDIFDVDDNVIATACVGETAERLAFDQYQYARVCRRPLQGHRQALSQIFVCG